MLGIILFYIFLLLVFLGFCVFVVRDLWLDYKYYVNKEKIFANVKSVKLNSNISKVLHNKRVVRKIS